MTEVIVVVVVAMGAAPLAPVTHAVNLVVFGATARSIAVSVVTNWVTLLLVVLPRNRGGRETSSFGPGAGQREAERPSS